MTVRVYFEGDKSLREGFDAFFKSVTQRAHRNRVAMRFVAGGGGSDAVRDFMTALRTYPDDQAFLLIDCEGSKTDCSIERLKERHGAAWQVPKGKKITDDQVFRMIQVMESWFFADPDALEKLFGKSPSIRLPNIETIPKSDVLNGLGRMADNGYHKTRDAPRLLGLVREGKLRAASPEADRLFLALETAVDRAGASPPPSGEV